jgi:hypothetical protein
LDYYQDGKDDEKEDEFDDGEAEYTPKKCHRVPPCSHDEWGKISYFVDDFFCHVRKCSDGMGILFVANPT